MKKIIAALTTLLLIWAILMFSDYIKSYVNNGELLFTINTKETEEYTKKTGLGYSVKKYDYDINNVKDGQIVKEFAIFNFVVSKEVVVINK